MIATEQVRRTNWEIVSSKWPECEESLRAGGHKRTLDLNEISNGFLNLQI